jgi:hypothetical protein
MSRLSEAFIFGAIFSLCVSGTALFSVLTYRLIVECPKPPPSAAHAADNSTEAVSASVEGLPSDTIRHEATAEREDTTDAGGKHDPPT